jgi:hypothetical protein
MGRGGETWTENFRRVGQQLRYMACDSMHVQPFFLAMHDAEVHRDASAYPRPKTTWQ